MRKDRTYRKECKVNIFEKLVWCDKNKKLAVVINQFLFDYRGFYSEGYDHLLETRLSHRDMASIYEIMSTFNPKDESEEFKLFKNLNDLYLSNEGHEIAIVMLEEAYNKLN